METSLLYLVYRQDKLGTLDLRMKTRPAHMVSAEESGDKLFFAGPAMDDDGNMFASVRVIDVENSGAAEAVTAQDLFEKLGLFGTEIIRRFMKIGGEGGGPGLKNPTNSIRGTI